MVNEQTYLDVPEKPDTIGGRFEKFVEIIAALRSENGCPWDREQTHLSISRNMIEEAYEAVSAIESNDSDSIKEELGDVLLEVVLQAQIADDEDEFDINGVLDGIIAKMIRRHPHVFGYEASFDAANLTSEERRQIKDVSSAGDVEQVWAMIKKHEKAQKRRRKEMLATKEGKKLPQRSILDDVSSSCAALMQAQDISKKVVSLGFEWESVDDVWKKVYEEIDEYKQAIKSVRSCDAKGEVKSHDLQIQSHNSQDYGESHFQTEAQGDSLDSETQSTQDLKEQAELEFGDVLFTLVNVARKDGIDAESALRASCNKFRKRWAKMEQFAREENRHIDSYDIGELDTLWNRAKHDLG